MAIDNGIIDHDHQVLLSIINDFCEMKPAIGGQAEMQKTLARLRHYTNCHFAREERLQRAADYPSSRGHHGEHDHLVRRLDAISQRVAALPEATVVALRSDEPEDDLAVLDADALDSVVQAHADVVRLLRSWLVDHILKSDLQMKPYVAAMRPHAIELPSLWSAKPALLMPSMAAADALRTAKSWMPAGFRNEKQPLPMANDPPPREAREHPAITRMREAAQRIEMPVLIDPECLSFNSSALEQALDFCRRSGGGDHLTLTSAAAQAFLDRTALFERSETPDNGHRYRVARTGCKFNRIFGDIEGKLIDDAVAPPILARWLILLDGVIDYDAPLRVVGLAHAFGRDDLMMEALLAPFHQGERTEVLAVVSYDVGLDEAVIRVPAAVPFPAQTRKRATVPPPAT